MTSQFLRLPLTSIHIERDARQRREIDPSDIVSSIATRGVLNPIIVRGDPSLPDGHVMLVAGERRLEASRQLSLPDIPVKFYEDLSPIEAQIIELEENAKRKDLSWQDLARAIVRIHNLYLAQDPEWSRSATAEALGFNQGYISEILRVAKDMHLPKIAEASSLRTAWNMLARADDRVVSDVMSDIIATSKEITKAQVEAPAAAHVCNPNGGPSPESEATPQPAPTPEPPPASIQNLSFLEWAPNYSGLPFNFVHCDFPYGVNVFGGAWSGKETWRTYDDHPDIYWELCACLCENIDRVMAYSSHLMFWLSSNSEMISKTLAFFRQHAPSLEFNPTPLVWLKSDNVGIMPDPKRGPRQIYEVALIAAREDRLVVKPVGNAHSAPTDKVIHPHTKPVPVLKHFFQMFVDQNTRMLDPTCGSGAALRAAEAMGAEQVLGLEIDPDVCKAAQSELRKFRLLRSL